MESFYIKNTENIVGPLTYEELIKFGFDENTLVGIDTNTEFYPVSEIPLLMDYLLSTPPAPTEENLKVSREKIADIEPAFYSFKGRTTRGPYIAMLISTSIAIRLFGLAMSSCDEITAKVIFGIIMLALFYLRIAYGVRRCHDVGCNGFLFIVPFFPLYLIFAKGDEEDNEYGPSPYCNE